MEKQIEHRRYILEHFDSAIKNEYIKIWYQPIIRSMNRKISGMEILSRWEDPEIGMISPAEFIPVLEESRLIHKLDLYVLRQACSDMKQYWAKWRIMVPVSINFSRLDFELCHDLPGEITDISKAYNIPKEMLHIEITESALSTSRSFIKRELIRLEKAGYEIRLDDFGSGYSTLNSLDEYPFHVAKLDMIFMRNFGKSKNN